MGTKTKKSVQAGTADENQEKKSLLPQAEVWQSFHALAKHWQSDLKFFEDELSFFGILIDKNLSILIDTKNIDQTRAMVSHVKSLEKDRTHLYARVAQHVQHIALLVENPFVQDAQKFKIEHAELENAFAAFVKTFRSIKTEVFKINERVIHSEKVKRMIDWA